ncbi:MAG: DUF115 domain-containing protein [Treponema sp.]|jgi:hypothetical protein|nr:DUF115 domain-containing protein [Treponema sp.]
MSGEAPNTPLKGFSFGGKTLLSGIDPAGRAERIADAVPLLERTLYLCPSPLYGYGLERLLARLAPHSALLCIEADAELFALSREHFSAALKTNQQLRLTNVTDAAALCALTRQTWGPRAFRRVEMVRLSGGWQLFPELYESLADALRREIALDWGNALTLTKLGRRYIRNAMRNLALIPCCPSLEKLSFGDAPVLVLGAGPSLDKLLKGLLLRYGEGIKAPHTRPFRIVCVDTCLPSLREWGITPDLAVILESQHWNLRDFIGSSGWKVPAAMDISALPRSAEILRGGLFLFFTPWTELRIFGRLKALGLLPATLAPLGSVGLSAVEIARRVSRGIIITGGIDFSFTLDAYHARSTPGHLSKLSAQSRFVSLLNAGPAFAHAAYSIAAKSGQQVRSNPAMRNYRDLFQQEFASDPRLFDIAGSGLPLGVKTILPEEAFAALDTGFSKEAEKIEDSCAVPLAEQSACAEKLRAFIHDEAERLRLLRDMLCGSAAPSLEQLDTLIDECDYLWGHFPDYAGAGGRRPDMAELAAGSPLALSFLKRLRAEIDSFLKLWVTMSGLTQPLSAG